jgi:hypothetical protein
MQRNAVYKISRGDSEMTVALAFPGDSANFRYDSPLWTNSALHHTDGEIKTAVFLTPTSQVVLELSKNGESERVSFDIDPPESLQALFSGPEGAQESFNVDAGSKFRMRLRASVNSGGSGVGNSRFAAAGFCTPGSPL